MNTCGQMVWFWIKGISIASYSWPVWCDVP